MKQDINSLIGYKIAATDGELGEVTDFYFDDKAWTIRYLVVETGSGSHGKVLISPDVVIKDFREPAKFHVSLTVDQVRNSPDIDTNLPVSRQQREVFHTQHPWENTWESYFFGSGGGADVIPMSEKADIDPNVTYDIHLRNIDDVTGYYIHASDGQFGHVSNFILDDDTWTITQLVIDTRKWLRRRQVVIDIAYVRAVQWYNYEVFVNMKIEEIEHSQEYHELKG